MSELAGVSDPNEEIEHAVEFGFCPQPTAGRRADIYGEIRQSRYLDVMGIRIVGPASEEAQDNSSGVEAEVTIGE